MQHSATLQADKRTLATAHRLIVKIGSRLLIDASSGQIRYEWLHSLADDIAVCRQRNQEVVLVSSGAVALGREQLGLSRTRPLKIEEKQAIAAIGQMRLAHTYQEVLAKHQITVAQILLTLDDTENRRRHLNARTTIDTLLAFRTVPVINENDTVTTSSIRVGDNDRLAARIAQMISADTLVLLSDIQGLYTADPHRDHNATLIPEVTNITPQIEAIAGKARPGYSSGGMVTKIAAARITMTAGCRMVICQGQGLRPLASLEKGEREGTWFLPSAGPRTARKRWIAGHLHVAGIVVIDAGAVEALRKGRSLLPAGVRAIKENFERGDLVAIHTEEGREIGRGLCAYNTEDARRIMGKHSTLVSEILGYRGYDEIIHRDNLVLL